MNSKSHIRHLALGTLMNFFVVIYASMSAGAVSDYKPDREDMQDFRMMRREWSADIPEGGPTTLRTYEMRSVGGDRWAGMCFNGNMTAKNVADVVFGLNLPGYITKSRRYSFKVSIREGTSPFVVSWILLVPAHQKIHCEIRSINLWDLPR